MAVGQQRFVGYRRHRRRQSGVGVPDLIPKADRLSLHEQQQNGKDGQDGHEEDDGDGMKAHD